MAKTKTDVQISVSAPSPARRIESKRDEKTVTVYANNAYVEASNWDVRIRLGQIQSADAELISVLDVAHVYMSHEHAKAFLRSLEATLGKIDSIKGKASGTDSD